MVREEAPLRFAVCAVNEAENDAAILVWGQEFPDGRVEVVPDLSRVRGSFRSVDSLLRRMRACGDHPLRLVRLDPERPPTTPGPL
ncbi:hypothetical protein Nans01_39350 [Nocardiopsis ansamitocini]|uniref:Uncharacterized protein n=2 Tax=Nocardiopsis ansamitocini TaxID=1670832 RepID=A0A9W6P9M7_9ACTN|nr:hypothetical protein Nans01_39350 [Nocardiopsis ansamitocini]